MVLETLAIFVFNTFIITPLFADEPYPSATSPAVPGIAPTPEPSPTTDPLVSPDIRNFPDNMRFLQADGSELIRVEPRRIEPAPPLSVSVTSVSRDENNDYQVTTSRGRLTEPEAQTIRAGDAGNYHLSITAEGTTYTYNMRDQWQTFQDSLQRTRDNNIPGVSVSMILPPDPNDILPPTNEREGDLITTRSARRDGRLIWVQISNVRTGTNTLQDYDNEGRLTRISQRTANGFVIELPLPGREGGGYGIPIPEPSPEE